MMQSKHEFLSASRNTKLNTKNLRTEMEGAKNEQ